MCFRTDTQNAEIIKALSDHMDIRVSDFVRDAVHIHVTRELQRMKILTAKTTKETLQAAQAVKPELQELLNE